MAVEHLFVNSPLTWDQLEKIFKLDNVLDTERLIIV